MTRKAGRQNVTISISLDTVRQARILAAERSTSISALLAEQDRSQRAALAMLEQGFHLGGQTPVSRDELHDR